jgi:fructokinase
MSVGEQAVRIGIDLGGTKIEAVAMTAAGAEVARHRMPAPRGDYAASVAAICELAARLEQEAGQQGTVGIGMPGSLSPVTGLVRNANSTWLNSRPLQRDIEACLGRSVRIANDANCFALSEAVDGAGAGARLVFGVILGTGCGGGIVHERQVLDGPLRIGGEWGHNPLPWAAVDEHPGPHCWCGRRGCMETWVSGPALAADHAHVTGTSLSPEEIVARARDGDQAAQATLDRHVSRLARGLAAIANVIDPDVIVLGGGLSQLTHLYEELPGLMAPHIFSDRPDVTIRPPRWGDAGGVRGAAWLWNEMVQGRGK